MVGGSGQGPKRQPPRSQRLPRNTGASFNGPDRGRTDDLFHAMEALFQLSYRPSDRHTSRCAKVNTHYTRAFVTHKRRRRETRARRLDQ